MKGAGEMPDLETIVLLTLVSAGRGLCPAVSGFGLGIFAMIFLPYFLPTQAMGATVSGLISCIGSGINAIKYRKSVQWKAMLPLVLAALCTIPLAVMISASAPDRILKPLLGVVLILISIYFLFFSGKVSIRPTVGNGIFFGAMGGMLGGLFSTGGPPAVLYLIHACSDNLAYFATIQTYFAITNLFTAASRAISGMITQEVLILFALGMVGWWVGNFIGGKVFSRLNPKRLKQVIYVGMIISGVLMLF